MESPELPPLPQEHLVMLQPLTDEQLGQCYQQATADRHDHIRSRHRGMSVREPLETFRTHLAKTFAEEPSDPFRREMLLHLTSDAVTRYWSHLTKNHATPEGSEEDYLKQLAKHIRRDS